MVEEDWTVPASEVEAILDVPCAEVRGGTGRYDVLLDDRSGMTVLFERERDRAWLREPFGTVSDRCWWLPEDGAGQSSMPAQPCVDRTHQLGTCTATADAPDGWRWVSPGVADAPEALTDVTVRSGLVLGAGASGIQRLDLTIVANDLPQEGLRTWLRWVDPITPRQNAATAIAAAQRTVTYDTNAGRLEVWPEAGELRAMTEPMARASVPEGGFLAADGPVAAVVSGHKAHVFSGLTGELDRDRRRHPALEAARDVVVDGRDGTVWALLDDGVIGLPADGDATFHPTPGAEGLFLGRPAGVSAIYAWGNRDGDGVIYRLDGDGVASAAPIAGRLLGAGTGEAFQEIVVVTGRDGQVAARGLLDRRHVDAIAPGTIGLALAAFAETPTDPDLIAPSGAIAQVDAYGPCPTEAPTGLQNEHAVCCAHHLRGEQADVQLDWLDARLQPDWPGGPAAVVLGVNPTSLHLSRLCNAWSDPAISSLGDTLPEALGRWLLDWEARGVGAAAVFGHTAAWSEDAWWVECTDLWTREPPQSCWALAEDEATLAAFYQAVADEASLQEWTGQEPDWTLFGGAYDGANLSADYGWPEVFPSLVLPDGEPPDGLYFGGLTLDPRSPTVLGKELAPADAAQRPFPIAVNTPADHWEGGGEPVGATYWPGQTWALPYLWETRRSGLAFGDWVAYASPLMDETTDAFRGEEHRERMNHADFALAEHYLVTRVLAHRDVQTPRFWYVHLQDVAALRSVGLGTGWIDCPGDCADDSELDRFLLSIAQWPAIGWSPKPPPG